MSNYLCDLYTKCVIEFIYEVIFLSRFHYQETFTADTKVKIGLFKTIESMYPDIEDRVKVDEQLEKFKKAEGMLGMSMAIMAREKKQPSKFFDYEIVYSQFHNNYVGMHYSLTSLYYLITALWWESYGEECKELQKLTIRVLSLTCSATGVREIGALLIMCTRRKETSWNNNG